MQLIRIVFLFFGLLVNANANQSELEYKIKAAYLYNFTKFIDWPDKSLDTFNLCILGKDPFGAILTPLLDRKALGKSIKLIHLNASDKFEECHILYVDKEDRYSSVLQNSSKTGVLVVSSLDDSELRNDHPFFAGHGGMIGFVIKNGRVKLQLDLAQLKRNGMSVSAKLMEVVEQVNGAVHE